MPTTDLIQRVADALVAVLDTLTAMVALTSRPNGNVLPYDEFTDAALPAIAYLDVTGANAGGIGDTRRVVIQFTAAAGSKSVANALLEVVENALTPQAFTAAGLDACIDPDNRPTRRGKPGDTEEGTFEADMDVTLIVTK
jgi:hypothetical protein